VRGGRGKPLTLGGASAGGGAAGKVRWTMARRLNQPQPTRREQLLAAISAQEAAVRELRATEHTARNIVQRRKRTLWQQLTGQDKLHLRLVWDLCQEEATLTRAILGMCAGGRTPHAEEAATATQAVIENIRSAVSLRGQAATELAERPNGRRVFQAARAVAELRTAAWIARANARGVAPGTQQLTRLLGQLWPRAGGGVPARVALMRLRRRERARNTWASRFRRRWSLSWRRLSARAALPRELAAQKAGDSIWDQKGARFWDQKRAQKWGRFLAPLFGPIFGPHFCPIPPPD